MFEMFVIKGAQREFSKLHLQFMYTVDCTADIIGGVSLKVQYSTVCILTILQ